jgi:protocatechuate 3,4-dioxygenase beta subunit
MHHIRLANFTHAELDARAVALREMSETAGTFEIREALERLSVRYGELAARRAGNAALGERITVGGRILDENSRPVPDALIEVWQTNAAGRYNHPDHVSLAPLDPNFSGHGSMRSDQDGWYSFTTIRPGRYPAPDDSSILRARHIHFVLRGAGLSRSLFTEMYLPDGPSPMLDPLLGAEYPNAAVRSRLIASPDPGLTTSAGCVGYRFDLILGGGGRATPFGETGKHPWLIS